MVSFDIYNLHVFKETIQVLSKMLSQILPANFKLNFKNNPSSSVLFTGSVYYFDIQKWMIFIW